MAVSYPLAFPTTRAPAHMRLEPVSVVGLQEAPLTKEQTVYAWPGDCWEGLLEWGPMTWSDAKAIVGFLAALNGKEGTFLFGDPLGATPEGTWGGTPLLVGAHSAQARTLAVDGFTAGATGKAGDYLQFGTSSSTRLHMVSVDFTADGSGVATVEIWPRLREAQADNAALTKASCKGLWRLNTNRTGWDVQTVQVDGISIPIIEARDG